MGDAIAVRDGLMDVLPGLINTHHLTAATVAADWYDLQRHNLGVKKRFSAVVAEAPTDARGLVMARWAVGPMFGAGETAAPVVLVKVAGALQRVIQNGARQTITGSTASDPGRVGWLRVGNGECDWCQQYLDGEVHYAEGYDFDAHDHCQCDAVIST
ncbi:MAG: hypothetical protein JWO15_3838 [Sphingomonadales bacterium]|nr:hypothetical protein [Sphingomonadales bacterium]